MHTSKCMSTLKNQSNSSYSNSWISFKRQWYSPPDGTGYSTIHGNTNRHWYIDVLRPKAWSCKHGHKIAMASNFTMFYRKVRVCKGIERFIAKTFSKRNNLPRHKYVMYFYLITYFLITIFYISVWFLCYSSKNLILLSVNIYILDLYIVMVLSTLMVS